MSRIDSRSMSVSCGKAIASESVVEGFIIFYSTRVNFALAYSARR